MEPKKGTLYFFTGLSGAGKTTIGGAFYRSLKAERNDVLLLDGDQTRPVFNDEVGYSAEERLRGSYRLFRVCKMLTDQGIDVVCCAICMHSEVRAWAREHIDNYREIYIKVTRETLFRRDQKGLYSSGAKNVMGIDIPFDEPKMPDIVVENDAGESPERIVDGVRARLGIDGGASCGIIC